jgi:hypothetical protein
MHTQTCISKSLSQQQQKDQGLFGGLPWRGKADLMTADGA